MRFRPDVNALNDWDTGDAGMPEYHTLVSAGFGGARCML